MVASVVGDVRTDSRALLAVETDDGVWQLSEIRQFVEILRDRVVVNAERVTDGPRREPFLSQL